MADPKAHRRYLDYRERHMYFGKAERMLSMEEYITLDVELDALVAKGEDFRDDEEEQRFTELARLLFRD